MYLAFQEVFGRFRSVAGTPESKVESAGQDWRGADSVWSIWSGQFRNWGLSSRTGPRVPVPNMGYRYPKVQGAKPRLGWLKVVKGFWVISLEGYFGLLYSVLLILYSLLHSSPFASCDQERKKVRSKERKKES